MNDAIQFPPDRGGPRHHGLDPVMLLQPIDQERVFHRVLGSNQAYLLQPLLLDGLARGVANMEDRDAGARRYLVVNLVRRVGTKHDALRPGGLQTLDCVHEGRSDLIPLAAVLKLVDVLLIEVEDNQR